MKIVFIFGSPLAIITEKLEAQMSAERVASELMVAILPLGDVSPEHIALTTFVLEEEFGIKTMILPAMKIPSEFFNAEQGRYCNAQILNFLFSQLPVNAQRIIGILAGKLSRGHKKTPLLGSAFKYDRAGVYSVLPVSEWDCLSIKDRQKNDRVSYLVIAHEFGHTFGLKHCEKRKCLMHKQAKKIKMCEVCRRWTDRELQVKPTSAEDRFSYAESLLRKNSNHTQAIAVYREAIALAPREPLYYYCLAAALHATNQTEESELKMVAAIAHSKDYPGFYYISGLKFLEGSLNLAEESFTKAIATAKDPKLTHRLVGQAYREILHDVERASRHYLEYLRLGGDDRDVVDWLVSRSKLEKK